MVLTYLPDNIDAVEMFCCRDGVEVFIVAENGPTSAQPYQTEVQTIQATLSFKPSYRSFHYHGKMKRRLIWLVTASLTCASPHVFSVADDVLAYPQVSPPKSLE